MEPLLQPIRQVARRPLEYVAFWQFLGFVLLVLFVWTIRVLDLNAIFDQRTEQTAGWYEAWIVTIGIILVGGITVAHTYLQERRILRGYIIVCSYCHKVQLDREAWQQMEIYVSDRTLAEFTHGVCPSCYDRVVRKIEKPGATTFT